MDAKSHFLKIKKNLEIIRKIGVKIPDGEYLCPECLTPFEEKNVFKEKKMMGLTEEDVPQASLGGSRITLTCRKCNSNCGAFIDVHLQEALKAHEQQEFLPNTDRKVSVIVDGQRLNAKLEVGEHKDFHLIVNTKFNNPKVWDDFRENKLVLNAKVELQDAPLKHQQERIEAAIIKNAYLLLFAQTGFTLLSHSYYDCFRNVILNPDKNQLPVRLWTMQNLSCPNGVFMSNNKGLKGFFVSFLLSLKKDYKFLVFIPVPESDYNEIKRNLTNIKSGDTIKLTPLNSNKDYLTDETAINELRKWSGLD